MELGVHIKPSEILRAQKIKSIIIPVVSLEPASTRVNPDACGAFSTIHEKFCFSIQPFPIKRDMRGITVPFLPLSHPRATPLASSPRVAGPQHARMGGSRPGKVRSMPSNTPSQFPTFVLGLPNDYRQISTCLGAGRVGGRGVFATRS